MTNKQLTDLQNFMSKYEKNSNRIKEILSAKERLKLKGKGNSSYNKFKKIFNDI